MRIAGLQKLTLLDFPGHMACIVFTHGCNFRCPFCHNAALVVEDDGAEYDEETFFAFLEKRKGVLDGVVITGGEPLMAEGIEDFIRRIKSMGLKVKLDTNGSFPGRLSALLKDNLLDYIAMDIKALPEKYETAVGVPVKVENVLKSVELIKNCSVPHEFRTTVVKGLHTEEDIVGIAATLSGEPYFLQGFVDSGALIGDGCEAFSADEMHKMHKKAVAVSPLCQLRGIE